MPDLVWNRKVWDGDYDWSAAGEEWSAVWGGSHAQWYGSILPRVSRFLPARHILEIAPGYGRWTRFLLRSCEQYTGVDLSLECIEYCRSRFGAVWPTSRFIKNDGSSLAEVEAASVDFVFSFDSLVHVEIDVLSAYLRQVVQKLTPQGVAFLHHSNWVGSGSVGPNVHHRAESVSAALAREVIETSGGRVLVQEEVNWGGSACQDCLTLLSRQDAYPDRAPVFRRNPDFMREAELIRLNQSPYSTG